MPDRPGPGGFPGPGNPVKAPPVPGQTPKAGAPKIQGQPGSPCLVSFPSAGIPLVGSVGGGCLLSKTNVRAMVGGLLIGAGAVLTLGGVVVLAAAGFRKTGAASKIAGVAGVVPGGQLVGAGVRAAGGDYPAAARGARRVRMDRAAGEERQRRQLGEPRENPDLRVGKGAVRETREGTRRRKAETGTRVRPAPAAETGF